MPVDLLAAVVAAVCYALLCSLRVDLGHEREVPLGAAYAPALALLGARAGITAIPLVVLAMALAVLFTRVVRRPWSHAFLEGPKLALCFVVVRFANAVGRGIVGRNPLVTVAAGSLGVVAYATVAVLIERVVRRAPALSGEDRMVWLVLHAVLVSSFGLMILVYQQIGWPAFVVMVLLLALTKREFDRYAVARRTLSGTVSALEALELRAL